MLLLSPPNTMKLLECGCCLTAGPYHSSSSSLSLSSSLPVLCGMKLTDHSTEDTSLGAAGARQLSLVTLGAAPVSVVSSVSVTPVSGGSVVTSCQEL